MDTGIGPAHVRIRAKIFAVLHEVNPWKVSLPNVFAKIDKIVYMFTSWIFDTLAHGHPEKAVYNIDDPSVTDGCLGPAVRIYKTRAWIPND